MVSSADKSDWINGQVSRFIAQNGTSNNYCCDVKNWFGFHQVEVWLTWVKGIISTLASLATGKVQTRLSQIWAIRNRIKHLGCVMSWNHLSGVGWSSKRDGMAGVQISGFTASGQATVSKCDCRTTEVHSDFLWRHVPARPGFYSPPASPQIVVHVVNWEGNALFIGGACGFIAWCQPLRWRVLLEWHLTILSMPSCKTDSLLDRLEMSVILDSLMHRRLRQIESDHRRNRAGNFSGNIRAVHWEMTRYEARSSLNDLKVRITSNGLPIHSWIWDTIPANSIPSDGVNPNGKRVLQRKHLRKLLWTRATNVGVVLVAAPPALGKTALNLFCTWKQRVIYVNYLLHL